jgi:NAD(P)-dependent dehydrogenase (short-subunit alcohol dehydrogenase family)
MQIDGRTVLVTGGASGLGAATAEMLADAGGRVVVLDLNENAGQAMASRRAGAMRFIRGDVTSEADVSRAVGEAIGTFGELHAAVNVAGIPLAQRVLPKEGLHSLRDFTRVIEVNLIGTFNVIRLAAAAMARHDPNEAGERGVIVNTSSVSAFDGQIGQAAYAASKGGVASLTLPVARELARIGVRVVTIAPGTFDTPLLAALPEAARQSLAEQVPFPPRLGRPEEYASLVRQILENEMLNGAVIRLDGALRMAPK